MTAMRWATFDCFGTLIDWRHGIRTSADLLFPGRGDDVLDRYDAHEPDVEREQPGMRYRDVLAESLRRAAADLGLPLRDDDAAVLGATIPFWPAFADVAPELGALRAAGWRLALLTNCDRDIIGHSQRRLGVVVDAVVTAEVVGSYKPAHGHFTRFAETFAPEPRGWVHVAEGYTFDIRPAAELGIPSVWINRRGEPHDATLAAATQPDLGGLLATVDRVAAGA
jgi:2-haloacid dehalogenase